MTKFSKEFRLRLVLEVEGGQSLTSVARRYGVGRTTLQNWFLRYQAGGMEQLIATNHYTQEFKLQAIFESVEDFREQLEGYIDCYNHRRIKLKLKGMSPVEYRTHSFEAAT